MSRICYRFSPDNLNLKTAIGIREPTVIRIPKATGVALYGPYIDLLPGRYEAVIRFDPDTPCGGRAMMDVCTTVGAQRLTSQFITAHEILSAGMSARLEFSCPQPSRSVEVRLFGDGTFSAGITAVEINGEIDDSTAEFQSLRLCDLPDPGVEQSIRKGRNLYEGYQRGIGLQFSDLGARIAVDPDFYRARALAAGRTIIGDASLWNIFLLLKFFLPRLPVGNIVEFGSYRGGSAIFMAVLAERLLPGVEVIGFDTFRGMPATDRAVDAHQPGGFSDVDITELRQYVQSLGLQNLTFVQGCFEETALAVLQQRRNVAFCHIDCDVRSAVEYAYDVTRPYMVPGGYWVFDDPFTADCIGAAEAVEDILIKRDGLNSEQLYPHYVFREPFEK